MQAVRLVQPAPEIDRVDIQVTPSKTGSGGVIMGPQKSGVVPAGKLAASSAKLQRTATRPEDFEQEITEGTGLILSVASVGSC